MCTDERAQMAAITISQCLNALGLLAAPQTWQECSKHSGEHDLRKGIVEAIDSAKVLTSAQGEVDLPLEYPLETASAPLSELASELGRWTDGAPPPLAVDLARRCLSAMNIPEPDSGWESFKLDE